MPTLYLMVNETENRNHIFRDVQMPVSVSALDRPAFDRTQLCLLEGLSNALDRQSVFSVGQSVCVSVNRSVVERLRPQFFTDFHQILHAAQKCGRFVAYCL